MKKNVKTQWDTIFVCDDYWCKKAWTYKDWVFEVMRDPYKNTFVKLNAYWFNVDVLKSISDKNPSSLIRVKQKWNKIKLEIWLNIALSVWIYLNFDGELQLFIPKDKFAIAI